MSEKDNSTSKPRNTLKKETRGRKPNPDTKKKRPVKAPPKKPSDSLLGIAKQYSGFEYYEDEYITKQQCAFLAIFERNLGNISNALKGIGLVSRKTYYKWRKENEHFDNLCEEVKEAQIDMVESKLQSNIIDGNLIAQMFYLKTIGKNRGYTERQEIESKVEVVGFDFVEATDEDVD